MGRYDKGVCGVKIKDGFFLHEMGNDNVVITAGDAAEIFTGMLRLNDTGVFLWKLLENNPTLDYIIDAFVNEYDVDRETAKKDVLKYIDILRSVGGLEE